MFSLLMSPTQTLYPDNHLLDYCSYDMSLPEVNRLALQLPLREINLPKNFPDLTYLICRSPFEDNDKLRCYYLYTSMNIIKKWKTQHSVWNPVILWPKTVFDCCRDLVRSWEKEPEDWHGKYSEEQNCTICQR